MKHEKKLFRGTVEIDGHEFIDCTFENATLSYGGGAFQLRGLRFTGDVLPSLQFSGPAMSTLLFLRLFWAIPEMRDQITGILEGRTLEETGSGAPGSRKQ